jgi:Tol biopolymer transport system component
VSSDGNLVAFQIFRYDDGLSDIFLRDVNSGTTSLVSLDIRYNSGGGRDSFSPMFSPDDRWLTFGSYAQNLTTNATGGLLNLFARDLSSNTNRMLSVGPDGAGLIGFARGATFSANSRYVAFVSASNSVAVYDLLSQSNAVVCTDCDNPSLSADGNLLAYETPGSGTARRDIVVKNLQTGATSLISVNRQGNGGGNGPSSTPLLSWDGRFVVFASKASDLVDNDNNNASDIFVRDRVSGTTILVSLNLQGTGSGNGPSTKPTLGADGRTVVFQSFASDLVPGDYNDRRDVFVLRLGGADSDGDGMDDDWEMAYFGTLARDGTGDFDGDGQTDLQEFLAGTDPTNSGSILRVLTLTPLGGGGTRVIWAAAPGKRYQVQFKDSLSDAGWTDLPGVAIAGGTTAAMMDGEGLGNRRFYRVILAP